MGRKIEIEKNAKPVKVGYTSNRKLDVEKKAPKAAKAVKAPKVEKPAIGANGHARAAKAPLTEAQTAIARKEFVRVNGIIKPKFSRLVRDKMGDKAITVFQVVGAFAAFHREVANHTLKLKDLKAYNANIKANREHWLTYKGAKYDAMRKAAKKKG